MLYALLAVSTLSVLCVAFVYRLLSVKIAAITYPTSEVVAAISRLTTQALAREEHQQTRLRFLEESIVGLANARVLAQVVKPKDDTPEPAPVLVPSRWARASGLRASDTITAGNE